MRKTVAIIIGLFITLGTAFAQEAGVGAGRVEIGAFPGGGIFFGKDANDNGPNFGNYALGASVTANFNKWVGVEGEVGGGIGIRQDMTFNGIPFNHQKTPDMLAYNGNVVVNPIGNDRAVVPYVVGGIGGLTLFTGKEVVPLGVTTDETYFTGNVGGGVKWFATRHIGLRADGRVIAVKNKDAAPFFGYEDNRYGVRIYGGLVLTY
jgi:Outer membrane protein beta-barrel domain